MTRRLVVGVALCLALSSLAGPVPAVAEVKAQDPLVYQEPAGPQQGAIFWATARLFGSLLGVGALMAAGIYAYRRFLQRGSLMGLRGDLIRVVTRSYLGPRESVCLIQVGKEVFLLGLTGNQITLLSRWDDLSALGPRPESAVQSGFARTLQGATRETGFLRLESSVRAHLRGLQHELGRLKGRFTPGAADE